MRCQTSFGLKFLSLVAVFGSLLVISGRDAFSQSGVKNLVQLQPTTPGTSQSGHINVTGTVRAGQFTGSGAGLTAVPWGSISGAPASFPPNGVAAGDLTGTYPNPTVDGLLGRGLNTAVPVSGQYLRWDGSLWTATTLPASFPPNGTAGGDLSGTYPNPLVDGLQGRPVLTTAPTSGQVLSWNGTAWGPSAAPGFSLPFVGSQAAAGNLFSITNSGAGTAGYFDSTSGTGVSARGSTFAVSAVTGSSTAIAIYGKSTSNSAYAGVFDGKVNITGFAGLGTADPQQQLHVVGSLRVDNGEFMGHGSLDFHPDVDNSGDDTIRFLNSTGSEQVRMDSNGNIGIGTTSASLDLSIGDNDTGVQSGGDGILDMYTNGLHTFRLDSFHMRIGREGVNTELAFGGPGSGEIISSNRGAGVNSFGLDFRTASGGVPRMSITNGGNVGIGTQNPDALLRVNGTCKVNVLEIAGAGDLAEKFEIEGSVEPGMLVEIDPNSPGNLRIASGAYSPLVAGVVSGAKSLRPGVILDPNEKSSSHPIAMSGRVWVKCDSRDSEIRPGALLVASHRKGFAMAGIDAKRTSGAVIGKAMTKLDKGKVGFVLALVSLN